MTGMQGICLAGTLLSAFFVQYFTRNFDLVIKAKASHYWDIRQPNGIDTCCVYIRTCNRNSVIKRTFSECTLDNYTPYFQRPIFVTMVTDDELCNSAIRRAKLFKKVVLGWCISNAVGNIVQVIGGKWIYKVQQQYCSLFGNMMECLWITAPSCRDVLCDQATPLIQGWKDSGRHTSLQSCYGRLCHHRRWAPLFAEDD